MNGFRASLLILSWIAGPLRGNEEIVTLGDSLTFAYEGSFAFEETIFGDTIGDGFGPEVRNWIELLSSSAYRRASFELGPRDSISIIASLFPFRIVTLFVRQLNNWAIPGLRINQLRRFINGDATLFDLLNEDPDFSQLVTLLQLGGFTNADFAVADLEAQISTSAERLTLFIGGNDVRGIYGTVYDGGSAGSFTADFIDDARFILDWVLALNPNIQIVVVAVPHVGITPDVQSTYPTDPVSTARITVLLDDLNAQLKGLAVARGLGFADIYTPTLPLIKPDPLCIHGIPFINAGSSTGNLDHVWLDGNLSANFHPNTNAQAVIANLIIDAFNLNYGTGIAPLTATEMLGSILKKTPDEIDMPFATWMDCHGLTGLDENTDSDRDGIPAGIEFGTGLNPTWRDAWKIASSVVHEQSGPELEVSYPIRLTSTTRFTLSPAKSPSLGTFTPFVPAPLPGIDGLARARLPVSGTHGFLRLECLLAP